MSINYKNYHPFYIKPLEVKTYMQFKWFYFCVEHSINWDDLDASLLWKLGNL